MNTVLAPQRKGFTLLEILLVIAAIGILAAIVLIAINPQRQLAQARNAQRRADVLAISNAINQKIIDDGANASTTPLTGELTSGTVYAIGTATTPTACENRAATGGIAVTTANLDLTSGTATTLTPVYIGSIPNDPGGATAAGTVACTRYSIVRTGADNRITVAAPYAEAVSGNTPVIQVVR